MPTLRSATTTQGRKMAGARALWRATGLKDEDFNGKPIIAIANSYTQFVPGHVHLKDLGDLAAKAIHQAGGVAREFHTIAVDDGIAMGHGGMLYSLPSREVIADSVEYMANAHCADALLCISNCDKITPGMMMAAMRLNIPAIFISGGPMEAGRTEIDGKEVGLDLVDSMVAAANPDLDDETVRQYEMNACPTCGSCSGMFTANSMNCLAEALGVALPGNGTLLATHARRKELFQRAGKTIVELCERWYKNGDESALPRSIATFEAFQNAMTLDIAMGGSTNTVLHILAIAREAGVDFTMKDIDTLSRITPCLSKVAPNSQYHIEDVHRAGGIHGILGELNKAGKLHADRPTVHAPSLAKAIKDEALTNPDAQQFYKSAPGGVPSTEAFSQENYYDQVDDDRQGGCIRSADTPYSKDGGLAVLYGNLAPDGCIVKTAGVAEELLTFKGTAAIFESQESAMDGILNGTVSPGDAVIIRYEGPKGGPGMQEMLYPTSYLKSKKLDKLCALITDGRFSGGTSGLSIGHASPEAAAGGTIGLIEQGDMIVIDIPQRSIRVDISDAELEKRRSAMNAKGKGAWKPNRDRKVSQALKAYASLTTSASEGAVRKLVD